MTFFVVLHISTYRGVQHDILFVVGLWLAASWICIEMVWAEKSLMGFKPHLEEMTKGNKSEAIKWFKKRHKITFSNLGTLFSGLFISLVILTLIEQKGISLHNVKYSNYADKVIIFVTCFLGGMSQWTFHNISITVNNLGSKGIRPNLHSYRKSGIFYIGNVLSKIWFGGMGLIFLGEAIIFTAPISNDDALYFHAIIVILCVGAVVWFFVVQIRIHNVMVKIKENRLKKVSKEIDIVMDDPVKEANKSNIDEIEYLRKIHNHIKSLPEWPFNTNVVFRVLTAGIIPILSALLDIIM